MNRREATRCDKWKEMWLSKNQQVYQFHPRIVNLTNVTLTTEEESFLEKGLKLAIPPTNNDTTKTAVSRSSYSIPIELKFGYDERISEK